MTITIKNPAVIFLISVLVAACDQIPQTPNSVTKDGQNLSYAYFINDTLNHNAPTHLSISEVLAISCSASTCHGVGGGNGGTFKVYGLPLDDAKNISNFISAQAHVIKGQEDTSATVTTNNYPQAHTSAILIKPLSELSGGIIHKGNNGGDIFVAPSEELIITDPNLRPPGYNGSDYGEIYRWIAFDQP